MAYVNTPISFYCKEVSMMLDFYVTETPFFLNTSSYSVDSSGINAFIQSKTFLITVLHYFFRLRKNPHQQSPSNIFFQGLASSQIVVNVKPL